MRRLALTLGFICVNFCAYSKHNEVYPHNINVWSAKESSKIIGECKNISNEYLYALHQLHDIKKAIDVDKNAYKIRCDFTEVKVRKKKSSKSTSSNVESVTKMLETQGSAKLCQKNGFINSSSNDPVEKEFHEYFINWCNKKPNYEDLSKRFNEFLQKEAENKCYFFVHNWTSEFQLQSNGTWVSQSEPQDSWLMNCGRVSTETLYKDDFIDIAWNYRSAINYTNPNGDTIAGKCKDKLPNSEVSDFYGTQFSKNHNADKTEKLIKQCRTFDLSAVL